MNKSFSVLVLGILVASAAAQAGEIVRCFDKMDRKQLVLTGNIVSASQLAGVMLYPNEPARSDIWETMRGMENPRSRKYVGWTYFFLDQRDTVGAAFIFEPGFAAEATREFEGSYMVPHDERDGGTTHLHCVKTHFEG